jgi:hypothetical protein
MSHIISIETETLRSLLTSGPQPKCDDCQGTGWENWNSDGEDIKIGKSYDQERVNGQCETCKGVGHKIDQHWYSI